MTITHTMTITPVRQETNFDNCCYFLPTGAQLSKCQRRYREYAKNPIPGQLIPRCRNDGSFESVQCRNLDCYCVDENGDPIAGTSLPARLGKPKCRLPGLSQAVSVR